MLEVPTPNRLLMALKARRTGADSETGTEDHGNRQFCHSRRNWSFFKQHSFLSVFHYIGTSEIVVFLQKYIKQKYFIIFYGFVNTVKGLYALQKNGMNYMDYDQKT